MPATYKFAVACLCMCMVAGSFRLRAETGCESPSPVSPEWPEEPGRLEHPTSAKNPCEIAQSNLDRSLVRIASLKPPKHFGPGIPGAAIAGLERVERRFALTRSEVNVLKRHGLVVLDRLDFENPAAAFHEIYQSELPLYVSADAILHSVFLSNDTLIQRLEKSRLEPLLRRVVDLMLCDLAASGERYSLEARQDAELYLAVAKALLNDADVPSLYGQDQAIRTILTGIKEAKGMSAVNVFGRPHVIDWSQFGPRGHYTEMAPYFRGAMWLSRFDINLVSRSSRSSHPGPSPDPDETPREVRLALVLEDLAEHSGVLPDLNRMDRAWSVLAGRREDVSLDEIRKIRARAGIQDLNDPRAEAKLRAAIGNGYKRNVRMHYMPEDSPELPVILTMLGPRIVPDSHAMMPIVHPEVPGRTQIHAADMAMLAGLDRARTYLKEDLHAYPGLDGQYRRAQTRLASELSGADLYSKWLKAVLFLSHSEKGIRPSFMNSSRFQDLRLNSIAAGYGQIRHNYVLMAAQAYDEGGCNIPWSFVDPAKATYTALADYARSGQGMARELDPENTTGASAYFVRLEKILSALIMISDFELKNQPLPAEAENFLGMVTEMIPGNTGRSPAYTGWYFDLFLDRNDALKKSEFVSDVFTSAQDGRVDYLGSRGVRMGLFVVDTAGRRRIVVGPVTSAFESRMPLEQKRATDEDIFRIPQGSPWLAEVVLPAPKEVALAIESEGSNVHFRVRSLEYRGSLLVEILDHNRRPLASLKKSAKEGDVVFLFPDRFVRSSQFLHVQAGDFHYWSEIPWSGVSARTGRWPDGQE